MDIVIGIALFSLLVLALSAIVLGARAWLVGSKPVTVTVNNKEEVATTTGRDLLSVLSSAEIHIPSACGGAGTCGLCRVTVEGGGRDPIPVERARVSTKDLAAGTRLACQFKVRESLAVRVADEIFGASTWMCRVRANANVTSLIKELVLELPEGETADFRAGGFVELTCPAHQTQFADFEIDPAFHDAWDKMNLWRLSVQCPRPTTRAYSLASHPGEEGVLVLNIRVALPPPGSGNDIPPGVVSSYLFGLKPGDKVKVSGPFGHFFASDTDAEMIYIGGGAGMAPMRGHILDLLLNRHSKRKISFWYGARSEQEIFYADDFDRLAAEHENFSWTVALSDPAPDGKWTGETGFIHEVVRRRYLIDHPNPEDCEYYLCGPPMMVKAVRAMLDNLGVEADNIFFDDFGG